MRCVQVWNAFRAIDSNQAAFREELDEILREAQKAFNAPRAATQSGYSKLSALHRDLLAKLDKILAPTRVPEKKE
jgi:predicted nucleotide-binding protein (sugar kinase/HSP70/actin superfamily)